MGKHKESLDNNYDSLKDVIEFQNNMFNPGHYVGTGKVVPVISAPGNAMPLAIFCFVSAIFWLGVGLFFFFSDINFIGFGNSPMLNRIISSIIMLAISAFYIFFGFKYLKKGKMYYKSKHKITAEKVDSAVRDELWQRTCKNCGKSYDIDYSKCPYCKHKYDSF